MEQEPVVFSDTVSNNVLFGLPFERQRYDRAVEQARLIADFQLLEDGDQTVVGEKGITLSGGQKARLALARALYADGDIFLLDDPISAVDSKVAREIFEDCLKPLSREKTVILVTHQIHFLHECEKVLIMEEGRVKHFAAPSQLATHLNQMTALLRSGEEESEEERLVSEKLQEEQR